MDDPKLKIDPADVRAGAMKYVLNCVACHGASEAHVRKSDEGERAPPDIVFDADGATPVAKKNAVCLDCHESTARLHWRGSVHENEGVACSSCHNVHTGHDAVLAKDTQADQCYTCHRDKRGEMLRPSSHPLREGEMACSDCHNPHGSTGPTLLAELRKIRPDIKFVFVSGYAEDAFAKNLPSDAKFGFLPKPFSLKQLATVVKEVLETE